MIKNGLRSIMLLLPIALFLASCSAFKPISDTSSSSRSRSSRTTSTRTAKSKTTSFRASMVKYAEKYKGVKYRYAGQDTKGFDCSGYTCYVMKKFDVALPRTTTQQANVGKRISTRYAKAGDLVFFSKNGRGKPSHVGLVVDYKADGLYVLHSTSSRGVILENVSKSTYWKPRMLFVRDVLGRK